MRVVALNGSKRKTGNTVAAINEILDVLQASAITTELIHLVDFSIENCSGCWFCNRNAEGECSICDDLPFLQEKFFQADGIILGSPVYFGSAVPQILNVINRCGILAKTSGNPFKYKVGAAVVTARRAGVESALSQINNFFLLSEMIIAGSTYWNFIFGSQNGYSGNDQEGFVHLKNLGENMAWLIKCIDKAYRDYSQMDEYAAANLELNSAKRNEL